MNIKRNIFSAVAGAMLVVSLPASAQLLGGGLGGGAGGMLGGAMGPGGLTGSGGFSGNGAGDISGDTTGLRDRVGQAEGRTREIGGQAATEARSRAGTVKQSASSTTSSTTQAASSAGNEAASNGQNGGALSLGGGGAVEKNLGNRNVAANGRTNGNADAKPGQFNAGATGDGAVSMKKNEPAAAAPQPAPAQ